jgi:hypothetical protein
VFAKDLVVVGDEFDVGIAGAEQHRRLRTLPAEGEQPLKEPFPRGLEGDSRVSPEPARRVPDLQPLVIDPEHGNPAGRKGSCHSETGGRDTEHNGHGPGGCGRLHWGLG